MSNLTRFIKISGIAIAQAPVFSKKNQASRGEQWSSALCLLPSAQAAKQQTVLSTRRLRAQATEAEET